jgi:hypothetical protein
MSNPIRDLDSEQILTMSGFFFLILALITYYV